MNNTPIKSFEEACVALGYDPTKVLPDVSNMPEQDQKAITAFAKMCIIHRALNGEWKADWGNYDQRKYYPWFDVEEKEEGSSGFGLSYNDYGCVRTGTDHGVRLFYPDADTAKYAGETFKDLYEDMILLPK